MSRELTAGVTAFCVTAAMFGWWVFADVLLSDDYALFKKAPDFSVMMWEQFRPVHSVLSAAMAQAAKSSPNAVYWLKALHVALCSTFAGVLGALFAKISRRALAGIAVALLLATSPAYAINAVWLSILPQWCLLILTAVIMWALHEIRDRDIWQQAFFVFAFSMTMLVVMLTYQMPAFYLIGMIAAYVALTKDPRQRVVRLTVMAAVVVAFSTFLYAVSLRVAIALGTVRGRAAQATDPAILIDRLTDLQPTIGLHWLDLFAPHIVTGVIVIAFIAIGAALDIWRSSHRRERALRWTAAAMATIVALVTPALLNNVQPARVFSGGTIGASGMLVAAALAMLRETPMAWRSALRVVGILLGTALVLSTNAAAVAGIGQSQHAELQHIRSQIAAHGVANLKRIHLIPPDAGPFWEQPVFDPAHGMYILRMSSYHPWTYEGLVRFALRYVDPEHQMIVTFGPNPPPASSDLAIVDMRPLDRALYAIPY